MVGRYHAVEPGGCENALGPWWEDVDSPKGYDEALRAFVERGEECKLNMVTEKHITSQDPIPEEAVGGVIQSIIKKALMAGYDVYDSDTRTLIFDSPSDCDDCASGECEKLTKEFLGAVI